MLGNVSEGRACSQAHSLISRLADRLKDLELEIAQMRAGAYSVLVKIRLELVFRGFQIRSTHWASNCILHGGDYGPDTPDGKFAFAKPAIFRFASFEFSRRI
ncbi:hypothetical protein D3C72_2006730 [compost metagenome]